MAHPRDTTAPPRPGRPVGTWLRVPFQEMQGIAGRLGVYDGTATKAELAHELADAGVFYGGPGDDRPYIEQDGRAVPLSEWDREE